MRGSANFWMRIFGWLLVFAMVLSYHPERTKPIPPIKKRIHTWTPAQETEVERLINTLDWKDPATCRNPLVIKYDLCNDWEFEGSVNDD